MAYAATRAVRVASQPGQPCRRAQAPIGSTAMVSASDSIGDRDDPGRSLDPGADDDDTGRSEQHDDRAWQLLT